MVQRICWSFGPIGMATKIEISKIPLSLLVLAKRCFILLGGTRIPRAEVRIREREWTGGASSNLNYLKYFESEAKNDEMRFSDADDAMRKVSRRSAFCPEDVEFEEIFLREL